MEVWNSRFAIWEKAVHQESILICRNAALYRFDHSMIATLADVGERSAHRTLVTFSAVLTLFHTAPFCQIYQADMKHFAGKKSGKT